MRSKSKGKSTLRIDEIKLSAINLNEFHWGINPISENRYVQIVCSFRYIFVYLYTQRKKSERLTHPRRALGDAQAKIYDQLPDKMITETLAEPRNLKNYLKIFDLFLEKKG